jgi:hypothetical protein
MRFIILCFAVVPLIAGVPALAVDQSDGGYTVTFMADISATWNDIGHIWVKFGADDTLVFGFYPDGVKGLLPEDGMVSDDSRRPEDVSYTWIVSRESFERGLAAVRGFSGQSYFLPARNCKDLVSEVARALGMEATSSFMRSPAEYLADLMDANPRKDLRANSAARRPSHSDD